MIRTFFCVSNDEMSGYHWNSSTQEAFALGYTKECYTLVTSNQQSWSKIVDFEDCNDSEEDFSLNLSNF